MENSCVIGFIKRFVGGFCFRHDGSLCHHVVNGRIISKTRSKYDIILIELCQLSIVSRYGTRITVAYFYHNNEWWLAINGSKSLCWFVPFLYWVLWRETFLFSFATINKTGGYHISDTILKLGCYIIFRPRSYYWINYLVSLDSSQI